MNDRPIINAPEPYGQPGMLDAYMPNASYWQEQSRTRLIDFAAIRGIIYRQRWLAAGVLLAALVAGIVFTMLATPMYSASSTVRIEPNGVYIIEGQNVDQGVATNQVYDFLSTQISVIQSRNLANTIAEDLNLGARYDLLGAEIDDARPPNISDDDWLASKQNMAASILHGSVSAQLPQGNWIIQINFASPNPLVAAEMANAYSAAFAAYDLRDTLSGNEYAQEYLEEQIALIRQRLQDAEEAANQYARDNGIIVSSVARDEDDGIATLTTANLANINEQLSLARSERIQTEQRWRSLRDLPAARVPEVQGSGVLQALVNERTIKETQLVELRQRYNDEFPEIQNLTKQIEVLDQRIERIAQDIKSVIRSSYEVALRQEQALERELLNAKSETLTEQDNKVQYSVLEREASALSDQLQTLLARYNEIGTATNVQSKTIIPLDSAVVPGSPYSPNLLRNLVLAIVVGSGLAFGLAVLRETLDDKIRSFEHLEDRIGLPLLGHTPFVEKNDIDSDGTNRFSSLMEAYASIRSTIDFAMPRDRNVIQLTSSQASEGKSTTAVIIAELFANLGRKTLLIDGDLRRPSVGKLMDIKRPEVGFAEVLLGHVDLKSAVIPGSNPNLEILPVGQIPSNPAELFASTQLRDFIAKYREEYSLIIFDSSPVLGLADAPMLSRFVDGTIFIMEANRVQHAQVRNSIKRLKQNGGNPIGGILTKYRALEAGQSYNYQYSYYNYGGDA